jgi:hypothetical protein
MTSGASLKITVKGKYRNINHFFSDQLNLIAVTKKDIKRLGYEFVEILHKYMLNEGSYKMKPLAKSTIMRKMRMGFPKPSQMLYEDGTFIEDMKEVRFTTTSTSAKVTTGPDLNALHISRSNTEPITYGHLVNWIVFGFSTIIPERNIFSPAVLEWEEKILRPFITKLVKRAGVR